MTRVEQIEAERSEKAANTRPDKPPRTERRFARVERFLQQTPLRIGVGGLGPGAGLGLGAEFRWRLEPDHVQAKLWGSASVQRFYTAGAGLELSRVTNRDFTFVVEGSHTDAPQLEYYGPGPDSSIHDRTNFRREDTLLELRQEWYPVRRVRQGCRLAGLLLNVGPGQNSSLASTEVKFAPALAPGVDVQSDYYIAGCSAGLDLRDISGDPHKGTYAAAAYERYGAMDDSRSSFHRISAAAEHYIPFLNRKRVIMVRAAAELSLHADHEVVPFYLQPTLGSDSDLRGFRRYRFHDENSLALTGEYRWEISTGFHMAVFADFGSVFHKPGQISLSEMQSATGFGLRFSNQKNVVARLDTGFSHEGVQVWLKFGGLF